MVQGGMTLVKYILFLFNLIFVVFGIVLVVFGGIAQKKALDIEPFVKESLYAAPAIMISVGVFIVILAFLGCCGAIKENHCMTITYSVLLAIIVILEIVGVGVAYAFKDKVTATLEKSMKDSIEKYDDEDQISKKTWDMIQHDFQCCGVNNSDDWVLRRSGKVPSSCCIDNSGEDCYRTHGNLFKMGCLEKLETILKGNAVTIGGIGLAFALIELLGIIFGCCLARSIRLQYEVV